MTPGMLCRKVFLYRPFGTRKIQRIHSPGVYTPGYYIQSLRDYFSAEQVCPLFVGVRLIGGDDVVVAVVGEFAEGAGGQVAVVKYCVDFLHVGIVAGFAGAVKMHAEG